MVHFKTNFLQLCPCQCYLSRNRVNKSIIFQTQPYKAYFCNNQLLLRRRNNQKHPYQIKALSKVKLTQYHCKKAKHEPLNYDFSHLFSRNLKLAYRLCLRNHLILGLVGSLSDLMYLEDDTLCLYKSLRGMRWGRTNSFLFLKGNIL